MRGIPPYIKDDESKSKKSHTEARGTAKSEVLKGYPKLTKLIEDSMYDTNLVHYISMVSEELNWVVKEKECFDVETGEVKSLYSYA